MTDTTWQFYTNNPEAWDAIAQACEQARETIDLENFIFTADEIGNRLIDICARKAEQGVKVRFIWDAAGSFSFFGSSIIDDLKKKGIELIFFKTLIPGIFNVHNYRSWYFRDHRRTLIIDGKIGLTGSVCIWKRMETWRDTHVRIEGSVVEDMQKTFNRMWDRAQGKKLSKRDIYERSDHEFEYSTNNPLPGHRHLYHRVVEAIRNSRRYIYITVPYFVPTHRLSRVLRLAALRGVDVKILIPERSDYPLVDLSARTFFHSLLKAGVKIYIYKGAMLHSKTIVIDGDWSSVGTMNMDTISLLYNFEANLISHNSRFAEELASHFVHDLQSTEEITFRQWKNRFFIEKIATFLVKPIRMFL